MKLYSLCHVLCVPLVVCPCISLVAPNTAHLKTPRLTLFIDEQNQSETGFAPQFAQLFVNKLP